jgi:hypothetical protein
MPSSQTFRSYLGFRVLKTFKKAVTAKLNAVPLEAFADCVRKLFKRFPCIIYLLYIIAKSSIREAFSTNLDRDSGCPD